MKTLTLAQDASNKILTLIGMQKKIFKSCVFFKESTQEEVSQTGNKNT
jgi:hypothetical protein